MELSVQNANLTDDVGTERSFEMIAAAGFTAVDWCLDHVWDRKQVKAGIIPEKTIFHEPMDKIIAEFGAAACGNEKNSVCTRPRRMRRFPHTQRADRNLQISA